MNERSAEQDWVARWDVWITRVGCDVTNGEVVWGAEVIDHSAVRRYLEPLEFDCPLHYDTDSARAHGHRDITAPYTSVFTFTIPAMWEPGRRIFTSAERDAQPAVSPTDGQDFRIAPEITGFFATDMEIEFVRAPTVGERLGRRGGTLRSCVPKWTSVGRGAFLTVESEVVSDGGDVVARTRNTVFAYEPVGPPPGEPTPRRGAVVDRGQQSLADVCPGSPIASVEFPITVYRLVMQAGASRDFNSIHHNSEYARGTGAPEMYAATSFLLGMWERAVRDYIGPAGTIRAIRGFRMKKFNPVGTTVVVRGEVAQAFEEDGVGVVELTVWSENDGEVTVGPGTVVATVPCSPTR